jgi:glycerate kinase
VISKIILVAHEPGRERVAMELGDSLKTGDPTLAVDVCPIGGVGAGFDEHMRRARAVVIAARRLDNGTLLHDRAVFEVATRARQAGVPCYAVTAENDLDLFQARILDLQVVLQAADRRQLRAAGRQLAKLV